MKSNKLGRYEYFRCNDKSGNTILVKNDGYRFYIIVEEGPTVNAREWTHLMEYKHCDYPGLADSVVEKMIAALEPANIETIRKDLLED